MAADLPPKGAPPASPLTARVIEIALAPRDLYRVVLLLEGAPPTLGTHVVLGSPQDPADAARPVALPEVLGAFLATVPTTCTLAAGGKLWRAYAEQFGAGPRHLGAAAWYSLVDQIARHDPTTGKPLQAARDLVQTADALRAEAKLPAPGAAPATAGRR